jgi:hypothetical protein
MDSTIRTDTYSVTVHEGPSLRAPSARPPYLAEAGDTADVISWIFRSSTIKSVAPLE